MISVAMTTYNGEKFVEKQLQSIFEQSKIPEEVVIVDDCSSDNTVNIVSDFIKKRNLYTWKIITLTQNVGFINSFKKAISETSGEIIFLCDQDDVWLPNKISLMSELMLENPNILSLASSFKKIDESDKEIKLRNIPFSANHNLIRKKMKINSCEKISPLRVVAYNISPGCTCAFRSSIKESFQIVDNGHIDLVHDWKINLIASLHGGLYYLNTPTILYRLHQNNTLGLTQEKNIQARAQACVKSAKEREIMQNIINGLIKNKKIKNNKENKVLLGYIQNLKSSHYGREKALNNKSILKLIYLVFRYNLFKNRVIETIFIDIISILKSKKRR